LLLLIVLILPVTSATSDYNYPKIFDHPWDHSPITVYIDNKSVPPHYNPSYYIQIEKALNYWEDGGNGKLNYTPAFKIVDSDNTDIIIRWVENLGKNESAPPKASGSTIPQIENGRFVHVDVVLGVGNYQGAKWIQYGDETMLFIAEHELGHALGLEHSNDKQDIMYPTYEHIGNISPFLLNQIADGHPTLKGRVCKGRPLLFRE